MKNLSDIINNHHNEIASFVDGVRKETYKKARAVAIDECIQILKDNIDYIETEEETYRTISIEAFEILEHLMEKANE